MRFILIIFFPVLILISCGKNPAEKNDYDKILHAEIQRRMEFLQQASKDTAFTGLPDVNETHKEISNLILLSKDAENADAVLKKINDYFIHTAKQNEVPVEGMVTLLKTMSLPSIESSILTNELNLLDKIIFTRISLKLDSTGMTSVY